VGLWHGFLRETARAFPALKNSMFLKICENKKVVVFTTTTFNF
jgi:hypothetical protein